MPSILDVLGAPIKGLIDSVGSIIGHVVTDPNKKNELQSQLDAAKVALESKALEYDAAIAQAQKDVLVTEIGTSGSWMQKNWRPLLMMVIIAILANNYILVPYLGVLTDKVKSLTITPEMFGFLTVGVGGYIGGRSWEKVRGANGSSNTNTDTSK